MAARLQDRDKECCFFICTPEVDTIFIIHGPYFYCLWTLSRWWVVRDCLSWRKWSIWSIWRCPFTFYLFYIKFVSSPLDWPYIMLTWQHKKRFGNMLQCHEYRVMTDSDSKSRCWSEMALWETCFGNNREHSQIPPNKCCFPLFSQYIWLVCICALFVCISSHCFVCLRTILCSLVIED